MKYLLLVSILLSACSKGAPERASTTRQGPVPESWYLLPEQGVARDNGSLPALGADVDHLFAAQAAALPAGMTASSATPPANAPADWVPWHLATFAADFALTTEGVLGALLFDGSAAVQADWVRSDAFPNAVKLKTRSLKTADLRIEGTAAPADVSRRMEPVIRAALATGKIHNELKFRRTVLSAAENFRLTAAQLDEAGRLGNRFPPSAFRLEIAVSGEGDITPILSAGAEVSMRFDWIVSERAAPRAAAPARRTPMGDGLIKLARALAPDVEAASRDAAPIEKSGFKLAAVRVGVGITAQGTVGIAQGSASAMGSIVFGDNEDEGGCLDPDGDGDCHNHRDRFTALNLDGDDGIPMIAAGATAGNLALAEMSGVAVQKVQLLPNALSAGQGGGIVYKIPHDRFRSGMRKAIGIASFFTKHASLVKGNWKIKELETEFTLSLTGTVGLVTLQGEGEIELEFEHQGV